jgi:signal transduction histidine kinase/CheY-like chemotaxis protein
LRDLDQTLEVIVQQAAAISAAPIVRLCLVEEGTRLLRCRVGVGVPLDAEPELASPAEASLSGHVALTGDPLAVADIREDPRTSCHAHGATHGFVSYLGLPVKCQDRLFGVLVFKTPAPRAYAQDDIVFLAAFAQQAALAIQTARLDATAVRLRPARSVRAGVDLTSILEQILEEASWTAGIPQVTLLLVDRMAGLLRIGAHTGTTVPEGFPIPVGTGLSGIVAQTGEPLVVPDTHADPRSVLAAQDSQGGMRTYLGLPIKIRDEILGVLTFTTAAPRQYNANEVACLSSFAAQAALAIENARLSGAAQRELGERLRAEEALRALNATLEQRIQERTQALDETRRAAEAASQAKEEFLNRMSHEFRTPLNFVLGFADLLVRETAGPLTTTQARYLNRIQMGGRHLLDLVNNLLDLTSPAISAEMLRRVRFPLRGILQEILDLLQPQIAAKRLTVMVAISPTFQVVADRSKLTQVLRHLLENAVKFTPDGGHVSLAAREMADDLPHPDLPAGRVVEMSVADSGVGIVPEALDRVFGAFEQADGSSERAHGGSGLGLALVRKLVGLHGGVVWAESPGVGHGTRVIVRLPQGGMIPATKQIVVVEDDPTILRFYSVFLGEAGYEVTAVGSAGAALAALQAGAIDLVILDLGLPDRPGIDLLRQMRADPKTKAVPVLVLTGRGEAEIEEALREGASECLTKPTTGSVLVRLVHTLLEQGREGTAPNTAGTGREAPGANDGV